MLPRRIRSFTEKENYIGPADSEIICYRHTDRQRTGRQTDKQTDRQTDKQNSVLLDFFSYFMYVV